MPHHSESHRYPFGTLLDVVEKKDYVYDFVRGTVIYPENSGRGVVQGDFTANKLSKDRIHGLQAFQAMEAVCLYYDGRMWGLPRGAKFGAYMEKAHRKSLHRQPLAA